MLNFSDIVIIFLTIAGLGLSHVELRSVEKVMSQLAGEALTEGYISASTLQKRLETGK